MRAYLDGMGKAAVNAPALAEPPLTVLAALGPWMTALGGQRIACVHPYNVTPEHTAAARKDCLAAKAATTRIRYFGSATSD